MKTRVWEGFWIRGRFRCTGYHIYWGLKNNRDMQSKNGEKICGGIVCSSFSVKELCHYSWELFSLYNDIKFWPVCTPHHWRTWWLRRDLGIVTRSCYSNVFVFVIEQHIADLLLWTSLQIDGRHHIVVVLMIIQEVLRKYGIKWPNLHRVISCQRQMKHVFGWLPWNIISCSKTPKRNFHIRVANARSHAITSTHWEKYCSNSHSVTNHLSGCEKKKCTN